MLLFLADRCQFFSVFKSFIRLGLHSISNLNNVTQHSIAIYLKHAFYVSQGGVETLLR